ncbi:MAG: hypothetical protein GY947_10770, partial [Rhodobacteraceae bacterium]|nr:hypothetical protein [Paracoccaceae bacterium]
YRLDGGETKSFDGIGELVKHAQINDEFDRVAFAWVHDFNTEDWIFVEDAFFVVGSEIVTPMGHGIVAFTAESDAQEFAAGVGGEAMRWHEVANLPVSAVGLVGHHHDADDMDHDDMAEMSEQG